MTIYGFRIASPLLSLCFDMKLRYFLFFIFFISYSLSFSVMAESIDGKKKELTGLQKKIKSISRKINDLKDKKNTLVAELKKLDIQYGKNSTQLARLEKEVEQLNEVLEKNRQQMSIKRQEIDAQKKALETQVKLAYGMGRNEKLKLMLNQENPTVSERMLVYYDYLNTARIEKITIINEGLQFLQDLEAEKLRETEVLQVKLVQIKGERAALSRTKTERKKVLTKINKRFSVKKSQLSRFKISEKKLKSLILSLQQTIDDFPYGAGSSKKFDLLKGKLPWPVQGKIAKRFGARRSGTDSKWDGVLLNVKEGTNIRAVANGRVVYADWLRGYGLLTILDHGHGYMTLYAFNQSLYKKVGDRVGFGAVIATVGQSGGQSGSGLYFGIRKKGRPVDPVKWCRKKLH